MSWWRRHWRLILVFGVVGAAGIVFFILYALRKKKQLADLQAQLALMKAGAKVLGLKADRKARLAELELNEAEADKVDTEIAEARKKAVAIVKDVSGMNDIEVALEFKKLGY